MDVNWKWGMLALAGLGLGAGLSYRVAMTSSAPARLHPQPAIQATAAPGWLGDIAPSPAPPAAPASAPPVTLAQRIERLQASADPMDAYRAWWLVHQCMAFQRSGRLATAEMAAEQRVAEPIPDPARFCAGMTERMKMSRIDDLERAARAGIEEAAVALVEEGPFGDPSALSTRPDDPLVKEWKERINAMLSRRAEQGAWASLYVLFTGFWFENPAIAADRQSALAYGMALRDIMVKLDGVAEQQAIPFNEPFLANLRDGLSAEQVAQASARATAIVARAAAQRAQEKR